MPGPSRPDGVAGRVSNAPSCRAVCDIAADRRRVTAHRPGQRLRGVVAGVEQQAREQLAHGVGAAGPDAGPAAVDRQVLGRAGHRRVGVEPVDRHQRGEHLQRRRRALAGVRRAGGEDGTGVQVGQDEPGGGQLGRQGRRAGRGDVAAAAERGTADGRHRPGQRGGATAPARSPRRRRAGAGPAAPGHVAAAPTAAAADGGPTSSGSTARSGGQERDGRRCRHPCSPAHALQSARRPAARATA